jgi:hypothetical protein
MTSLMAELDTGFPKQFALIETLEPYLQSRSVRLDLEAACPQSGQGISR